MNESCMYRLQGLFCERALQKRLYSAKETYNFKEVRVLGDTVTPPHINESRHMLRHVTRTNESCHMYEWVISHIWMRHVTHVAGLDFWSGSCLYMSHVPHMNESCHTHECVVSHIWMRHVTHVAGLDFWSGSRLQALFMVRLILDVHIWMSHITHEWVTSHTWMSHVTHMNESFKLFSWYAWFFFF